MWYSGGNMEIKDGEYNTEDLLRQALEEENPLIAVYTGGEDHNKVIGFHVSLDEREMGKRIEEISRLSLGVDQTTLEFFDRATEEEKEQLKTLAKIDWHKKELEKLNSKLTPPTY